MCAARVTRNHVRIPPELSKQNQHETCVSGLRLLATKWLHPYRNIKPERLLGENIFSSTSAVQNNKHQQPPFIGKALATCRRSCELKEIAASSSAVTVFPIAFAKERFTHQLSR